MKYPISKRIPFITILLSSVILMFTLIGAFTLIDNNFVNYAQNYGFGVKKVKIAVVVSLFHLAWWMLFFLCKKRKCEKTLKSTNIIN